MTDRDVAHLHPDLIPVYNDWYATCHRQQIFTFLVEGFRPPEQQAKDYAVGRDAQGNVVGKILTNARPGQSPHNFMIGDKPASRAFDFAVKKADGGVDWNWRSTEWMTAVTIAKQLNLIWGGDFHFRDADHLQLPD